MTFDQLEQLVQEHLDLVEMTAAALAEGRDRAAKFLVMQAILSNHLKAIQDVKVKVSTLEKASYAQAILGAPGKNVTENKIIAEADPNYSQNREAMELIDSEINWTRNHYDIFGNAHVMFRQYSRE